MKKHHQNKNMDEQKTESPEQAGDERGVEDTSSAASSEEASALQDRLLRLQADFENFRRRTQRERAEIGQAAVEGLAFELLPVIDHFEMGMKTAIEHQTHPAVVDGFRLVYDQLIGALAKSGLQPVDVEGQPFDPSICEAVSMTPSAEVPADTVLAQTRRGYRLGSKLLRAPQVVVSSGPAADEFTDGMAG